MTPPHASLADSRCFLIIGHGFVGQALATSLHAAGHLVTAVARDTPERPLPYPLLSADVSSQASIQHLADQMQATPPDIIVHCASSSRGGAESYQSVFVHGSQHLIQSFPDLPILFTSSTSVYGQTDGEWVDELSPTNPSRETSRLLLEAETMVTQSGGIATRLAGLYGPGRSIYLKRLLEGTATIESGSLSRYLNQVHQDDVIAALIHLMLHSPASSWGNVYNITDDIPMTQRDCLTQAAEFLKLPLPPESPPDLDRKRAWTHKRVSNQRLVNTGWQARYPSFLHALKDDTTLIPSILSQLERPLPPLS